MLTDFYYLEQSIDILNTSFPRYKRIYKSKKMALVLQPKIPFGEELKVPFNV